MDEMSEQEQTDQQAARPQHQGQVQLTERDLEMLRWVGEQGAVRADQVAHLLARHAGPGLQTPGRLSESATRVWRSRMKRVGAIEEIRGFHSEPAYLWATLRGLSLAGLGYKPLKPALSSLRHLYWCNEVRLFVFARRPEARWISERTLRSEHAQASQSKRQLPDIPDGLAETPNGFAAIEVELTDKQQSRLLQLVRRRATDPRYYTVWYFCSAQTKKRVARARADLADTSMQNKIRIYDLPTLQEEAHAQPPAPAGDTTTTEL